METLDAEGRPIRTWEFEQGRLHGKLIDWHANGHERRKVHYDQGIPQGELCEWDKTGKLVAQSTYENGRPHRTFVEKYPTGEKKVRISLLGPKEMVRVTFNWPEGTMRSGCRRRREQGGPPRPLDFLAPRRPHAIRRKLRRDKPVGLHTWWYANGQKQISGQFVNGQETGRWTWWHENSSRSVEGEFVEGKKEGEWTTWHPNGQNCRSLTMRPAKDRAMVTLGRDREAPRVARSLD